MALDYILRNNFRPNVGLRPEARKIGVLITDGKSQDDIVFNSQNLRDNGIELYAIGELRSVTYIRMYRRNPAKHLEAYGMRVFRKTFRPKNFFRFFITPFERWPVSLQARSAAVPRPSV